MSKVVKPPSDLNAIAGSTSLFLAGSIDMGTAEDWQTSVISALADDDLLIFNPRRDEWDASWEQSFSNPVFREQVEWEISALERASMIAMYFSPTSHAPITLLELGLFARSEKLVVCCPDGFWRKGNVDVVCNRFNITQVDSLPALIMQIRKRCCGLEK